MSTIDELSGRLVAALERVEAGVAAVQSQAEATAGPDQIAALQEQLSEEQVVNAQLQERLRKLSARSADADMAKRLESLDHELQRLRSANDQLRASNSALREANAAGVGDASLINEALAVEVDALRAARAADRAEADTILKALDGWLQQEAEDA